MIDIITINRDNKEGLEKTIESVINQTFFGMINYIIIDGDSTDGSKDIIEKYADSFEKFKEEYEKNQTKSFDINNK